MDEKDIKSIHAELSEALYEKPFKQAFAMCKNTVRDNYSCFPMLLKVAELYINNLDKAIRDNMGNELMDEVIRLTRRIQEFSKDDAIRSQAKAMEAVVLLTQGDGEQVLKMYGEECVPLEMTGEIISRAMCLCGEVEKAKEISQISAYQYLIALINQLTALIPLCAGDFSFQEEIVRRIEIMGEAFNLRKLNPNPLAIAYFLSAQNYCVAGNKEKTLEYLTKYFELKQYFKDFKLRGDEFFDRVERWLEEKTILPRTMKEIQEQYAKSVFDSPIFKVLEDSDEYNKMKEKYKDAKN